MKQRDLAALPPDFRFGVATADHQCESYENTDDIRDLWERVRGLTARGRATDFWNRYTEDVDLARGLGCRAFRLSLSWARLEPSEGQWDRPALQHYRQILQYIRDAGMVTVVTLHHNSWPLHVQAAGSGAGMLDVGFPARLAAYAKIVAQELGDLIDYYVTINEPNQLVYGFIKGWWMRAYPMPPGLEQFATYSDQMSAVLKLIPNLFRAHTEARAAIKAVHSDAKVGSNPLILGLPRWLQAAIDFQARRARSPESIIRARSSFSERQMLLLGKIDVALAQLTMTQSRMEDVLFSEGYYVAYLCVLHSVRSPLNVPLAEWTGRVAVTAGTAPANRVGVFAPKACPYSYASTDLAVAALQQGKVDLVFDDDIVLRPYATSELQLTQVDSAAQVFAAAVPLGNRAVLNAVDIALREFKKADDSGMSLWDQALRRAGIPHGAAPNLDNRKTVANIGKIDDGTVSTDPANVPNLDGSLSRIQKRGRLRVGVHPGVVGLCMRDAAGNYTGLEPEFARYLAGRIFQGGSDGIDFVELSGQSRLDATRPWLLRKIDPVLKTWSMLTTIAATNWWSLGMAGELPEFLCPRECVGQLDYIGLDYYWGVSNIFSFDRWQRLSAAMQCHYAHAPVWPGVLCDILLEHQRKFPDKRIIVIENGCVTTADSTSRADYLSRHIEQVQRAVAAGVPVDAYLCWSITSNREWGLPFDGNSDFGLHHINLDDDVGLLRHPTPASIRYRTIISARSA